MTRTDRLERIAERAAHMRWLQRQYFRTRDHRTMVEAKRAEAAFDVMLAELLVEPRPLDEISPGYPPTVNNPA